jgi:hypothetical protein
LTFASRMRGCGLANVKSTPLGRGRSGEAAPKLGCSRRIRLSLLYSQRGRGSFVCRLQKIKKIVRMFGTTPAREILMWIGGMLVAAAIAIFGVICLVDAYLAVHDPPMRCRSSETSNQDGMTKGSNWRPPRRPFGQRRIRTTPPTSRATPSNRGRSICRSGMPSKPN